MRRERERDRKIERGGNEKDREGEENGRESR